MSTSPLPPDPYKALGIAKDANIATIRSAHRKLVLTCHPDKFPDPAIKETKAEEFHRVQQAYELLIDDQRRETYHNQIRLAELRAERFREEGSTKRQEPAYSPRPTTERAWTTQPIFEEIRPRTRYYDEPRSTDSRPSPRHEEFRPRPRDYEDYDDFAPAHGSSKKAGSSGRPTESRQEDSSSRVRNRWKTATSKATEKAREKEYEDRQKSRDKSRRDDGQTKRTHVRNAHDGESASDMEPDVEAFMNSSHSFKKSERPRSYEDDKQRSRRKHESQGSSPDRETKAHHHLQSATEYIAKLSGKGLPDRDSRRRPSISRAQSSSRTQVPPPPPPPPMPPVDDAVRASARRGGISKSSKSSKRSPTEIVEPAHKRDYDNDLRRPNLTSSATLPSSLKPLRSATMETRGSERPKHSIRRVTTSPLTHTPANSHSYKSSKLRETHDSRSSSPESPEPTPRTTKTSYRVQVESDSGSEGGGRGVRPHYDIIDPSQSRRHNTQEPSPRTSSYRGDRGGGSSRHGPSRSHTVDEHSNHRPAQLNRAATDRAATERTGMLFGEMPRGSPEPRAQYSDVRHSPRYGKGDVNYTTYPRRSSPTEKDSRNDHQDAYAGYERRGSVPLRPGRAQEV